MFLDAVNGTGSRLDAIQRLASQEENLSRWFAHPSSHILHHEGDCCEKARLWFLSFARSMEIGSLQKFNVKAPVWLTKHFTWGPTEWPISWCDIVEKEIVDCGVLGALAREIFRAQGHEAHAATALLSYNEACTKHWKNLWKPNWDNQEEEHGEAFPWIGDNLVYHELCVLETPEGEGRFFDPTNGVWYEPHQRSGYAALLAVRSECPRLLRWGEKTLVCGEWINL